MIEGGRGEGRSGVRLKFTTQGRFLRNCFTSVSFIALGLASPVQGQEWQERLNGIEQGSAQPADLGGVLLTEAVTVAQNEAHAFDIPAQDLQPALGRFEQQAGLKLLYSSEVIQGRRTSGVQGNYAPRDALRLLLAGSGVIYSFNEDETVTLKRVVSDDSDAVQLDPITVGARAESPVGPDQGFVADRTVTGTKTDTPLIENPQSISVITRDQLDARAVQNVGEALQYTAGVRANTQSESSGLGGSNIVVRGFGGDGTAGGSNNEYLNGLRIRGTNFAVGGFEPYLFERIEVLKGPSSVLYGQGTPGGVVNHVSKRPTSESFYELQGEVGSFDRREGAFDFGGPIDEEGQFAYRLTGLAFDTDAQTDFTSRERKVIAPALNWQPSNDTSLTILTHYQDDDFEGGFVNRVPAFGSVFPNPNGEIPDDFYQGDPNFNDWDRQAYSFGYEFEHRFNDTWTVRQNTRYMRNDLEFESVFGNIQPDLRTLNRFAFGVEEQSDDITVDNQVEINFDTGAVGHTALIGLDYQRLDRDSFRVLGGVAPIDIFNPVYNVTIPPLGVFQSFEIEEEQVGVYVQDQIRYENWIVTLGGRYDWVESETKNRLTNTTSDQSDQEFSGRAAVGYLFDNGIAPYVSYSEAFLPVAGVDFSGSAFEPTSATQYEAGVKYQPPGYNAFITFAAFEITQENVLTADAANPGFEIQTGEIRSRGFEVEAYASLDMGLDLTASYTLLDVEITESNNGDEGNTPAGVGSARHSAAAWANYTISDGQFAGLGLGAGVRYIGTSNGDATNPFDVPGYTLVDAAIRYDLGEVSPTLNGAQIAVNASNLFDKDYVASCDRIDRCFQGIGRNVIATLKYSW